MDLRRIGSLPPYAFAEVNRRKAKVRLDGVDVIDLGFGNPDIASPAQAVETLVREARQPSNHRYSVSRGIPDLREALAGRYLRRFGVELDPDTEVISTIGAKEGLSHLMWTLVQPGDVAIVPEPSYPIHIYAPIIAGAEVRKAPIGSEEDYFEVVIVCSATLGLVPGSSSSAFPTIRQQRPWTSASSPDLSSSPGRMTS